MMYLKQLLKYLLIIGICLTFFTEAKSQQLLMDMKCKVSQGSYQAISGTVYGGACDDCRWVYNLPFTFYYDNYAHTQIMLCANGYATFWPELAYGGLTPSYIYSHRPSVHLMARDGYLRQNIYYAIQGSAPNRVAIYQFNNYSIYYGSSSSGPNYFQLKLYESSYKIEIVYGPTEHGSYNVASYNFCMGFSGRNTNSYHNVEPGTSGIDSWIIHTPTYLPNANRLCNSNAKFDAITQGLTITLGNSDPELMDIYPQDKEIIERGTMYGDINTPSQHPALFIAREAGHPEISYTYKIIGPDPQVNPNPKVIYEAHQAGNPNLTMVTPSAAQQPIGDDKNPGRLNVWNAKGVAAGPNGELDLQNPDFQQVPPGDYNVRASLFMDGEQLGDEISYMFTIPVEYDIAVQNILDPKDKFTKRYPITGVPIRILVKNKGIRDLQHFIVTVKIYQNGSLINTRQREFEQDAPNDFKGGAEMIFDFGYYIPDNVGDFTMTAEVELIGPTDLVPENNIFPQVSWNQIYTFNVAREVDLRVVSVLAPAVGSELWVGRPMRPRGRIANKGAQDCSSDSIFIDIIRLATGDTVYRDTLLNYVLTAGRYDTTDVTFTKDFTPPFTGQYSVCLRVWSAEDLTTTNKKVCQTFNVIEGMKGTFTIGTRYAGSSKNFNTIQEAVDALYARGITGSVVFELTDHIYNVGDINNTAGPALDLTSKITGVDQYNTITFKPSSDRASERGADNNGITINLNTGTGMGIQIGQSAIPTNTNAIVNYVTPSQIPYYANSSGYFIFDGGKNKSIRFLLNSPVSNTKFQAAFYLREGGSNNTIKNCIFESATSETEIPHALLPRTRFINSSFEYESNTATNGTSYSSAIVMRCKPPIDKNGANLNFMDTLTNVNNTFDNNDISGFGYGVVSLGTGVLFREGHSEFVRYYNKNNTIKNNIIHDVSRAGVFLGFEEDTKVMGNRIYNVNNVVSSTYPAAPADAGGIICGGDSKAGWNGYNNIRLTIADNEISNVVSNNVIYGIKVEQDLNAYEHPSRGPQLFPNTEENCLIKNNIIWDLNTNTTSTSRAGIHVFTQRNGNNLLLPKDAAYMTRNDVIVNNTIEIADDGGSSTGALIGIGLQEAYNAKIINNAIAMLDNNISTASPANALIFYQGIKSGQTGGLISNRNAYWNAFWYPPKPESNKGGAAVYGFIEKDADGNFVEPAPGETYDPNGFETLRQWRAWTGQDANSIMGDFTKDMEKTGNPPYEYRIKTPRPKGSILNNRGERIFDFVSSDIDGVERGTAGQHFDIGAIEFEGQMYLNDVEVKTISKPSAYKAGIGTFSDAEYIMTYFPVECSAILRNSGNLFQAGIEVRLYIYMEDGNGIFQNTPVAILKQYTDIVAAQSVEVIYKLDNSIFKTYSDLLNTVPRYVIPAQFNPTMLANVTPRFKFKIEVQADENNSNNLDSAITRFYIRKSETLNTLISAENSCVDVTKEVNGRPPTVDEIAGRLNYKALENGFHAIKYYPDRYNDGGKDSLKIDVFDRNSWEPKSVDYSFYKYLWYADADDKPLTRYQRLDISKYLTDGFTYNKKNLIIGSQEMVRENIGEDMEFVNQDLRAIDVAPSNPFGAGTNCHGENVVGMTVARDVQESIFETAFEYDDGTNIVRDLPPFCGLMGVFTEGEGMARPAYYYKQNANGTRQKSDSVMGIAATTLKRNVLLYGIDWRHFGNIERVMRSAIDFYEKNDGNIVSVELMKFDAQAIQNRVEVTWTTASEYQSDRFEVERADFNNSVKGSFGKVAEVKAAGKSEKTRKYGPVIDRNVEFGNTYIYRLKMINLDGTIKYSDESKVEIGSNFWLGEAMPNPASNNVKFSCFFGKITTGLDVVLFDMNGKKYAASYDLAANQIEINLSELSSGTYTLVIKVGDEMLTRQFQVVK